MPITFQFEKSATELFSRNWTEIGWKREDVRRVYGFVIPPPSRSPAGSRQMRPPTQGVGDRTGVGDKQCRSFTMAGKHALKRTNMKCINASGIV